MRKRLIGNGFYPMVVALPFSDSGHHCSIVLSQDFRRLLNPVLRLSQSVLNNYALIPRMTP